MRHEIKGFGMAAVYLLIAIMLLYGITQERPGFMMPAIVLLVSVCGGKKAK